MAGANLRSGLNGKPATEAISSKASWDLEFRDTSWHIGGKHNMKILFFLLGCGGGQSFRHRQVVH